MTNKERLEFAKYLERNTPEDFSIPGKYLNRDVFITVKHEKCGKMFGIQARNITPDLKCPHCGE